MSNSGYCSLIITGDDLDFSLIEETLKMEASEKRKKGEIVNRVMGAVQNDFLRFDEKTGGKYNPDKTLVSLLDKLMDNEMFLSNLSQNIAAVHLHKRRFDEKPCLAAAGTADYKNVLVAGVFRLLRSAVHGEPFRLREGDIVLKYRVCVRLYVLGCPP